jgi:hypothetical protein
MSRFPPRTCRKGLAVRSGCGCRGARIFYVCDAVLSRAAFFWSHPVREKVKIEEHHCPPQKVKGAILTFVLKISSKPTAL